MKINIGMNVINIYLINIKLKICDSHANNQNAYYRVPQETCSNTYQINYYKNNFYHVPLTTA